jgi:hypothetical protein
MIKAINKAGMISTFSDKVWALLPSHKNGFRELSDAPETIVPSEIIEFKAKKAITTKPEESKKIEIPIVEITAHKSDASAEMDIMREYLKEKGVKFHHLLGYDKLKELYDANKK